MSELTVVFDLDGTLVDSAPDLIATLNAVFRRQGVPEVTFEEGCRMIGSGIKRLIERGLTLHGRNFTPADLDALYGDYLAYYADHIADLSRPYPGVAKALDALAHRNFRLAVCTNKPELLARRLLDTFSLTERFAAIAGPDTFAVQKPDPEIFRRVVRAVGGDPARAVMVGDSETDIATARAAAVAAIAVSFGYTVVPLVELRPDHIIDSFEALPAAIDAVFPQRA